MFSTTFYTDFTIADGFWAKAIEETYDTSFDSFKNDIKYMTELCIVLNHKLRDWYHKDPEWDIVRMYNDLFHKCEDYIYTHFKWDDLTYFYHATD